MVKLSGIGHAIGEVTHEVGRRTAKIAESPGTRKGFKSLLGIGVAGGVFEGVQGLFGTVEDFAKENPVVSIAIAGGVVYVVFLRR
jgi:hypothetical protein